MLAASSIINIITNSLIVIEGLIKMTAFGCFFNKGAYFTDSLRGIDFVYCCAQLITTFYSPAQLNVLDYLGYLRPLRILTMFNTFKEERTALYESISDIFNILFVMILFWFVFAIFGIYIYRGKLNYCHHIVNFNVDHHQCEEENEEWHTYEVNFDDITQAIRALFILATLDEWGPIL